MLGLTWKFSLLSNFGVGLRDALFAFIKPSCNYFVHKHPEVSFTVLTVILTAWVPCS